MKPITILLLIALAFCLVLVAVTLHDMRRRQERGG